MRTSSSQALDLAYCDDLNVGSVATLVSLCPRLQWLSLRKATLDDGELIRISTLRCVACPSARVDEYADKLLLVATGRACPELLQLHLHRCRGITAAGVAAVGVHCPKLQVLRLAWCHALTDESLSLVLSSLPHLAQLDVAVRRCLSCALLATTP